MKKRLQILVGSILLIATACQENTESKSSCCHHKKADTTIVNNQYIQDLKAEIMILHDEVMPKDPYLYELRGGLEASEDSVQSILDSVKLAQAEMHKWMSNYDPNHDPNDTLYFQSELLKVTRVNELYKFVIPAAEKVIK